MRSLNYLLSKAVFLLYDQQTLSMRPAKTGSVLVDLPARLIEQKRPKAAQGCNSKAHAGKALAGTCAAN